KFVGLEKVSLKKTFSITHAGTLYYFQRVETFLAGLNLFMNQNPEAIVETTFYGLNYYPAQIDRIKKSAGKAKISFTDKVPHEQMLRELASSHLQLLVATPEKHQVYGKVFDYIASGRPTLMVENDKGPLEWILGFQKNSAIASSPKEVANYLRELYHSPDKQKRINREGDDFTRKNKAGEFASLVLKTIE
ncbi:MAG: hypothetical protein ACI9UR_001897, partial [Bacteroidia bacterium]